MAENVVAGALCRADFLGGGIQRHASNTAAVVPPSWLELSQLLSVMHDSGAFGDDYTPAKT